MKKNIALMWVKMLRSSEYEYGAPHCMRQGVGENMLYDPLGVLCELAVKAKVSVWKQSGGLMPGVWWSDGESPFWPSEIVLQWAGVKDMDYLEDTIMEAYDDGTSVKAIADFIEENYKMF